MIRLDIPSRNPAARYRSACHGEAVYGTSHSSNLFTRRYDPSFEADAGGRPTARERYQGRIAAAAEHVFAEMGIDWLNSIYDPTTGRAREGRTSLLSFHKFWLLLLGNWRRFSPFRNFSQR